MRIYVDIHIEECPSGRKFYSYNCIKVESTFEASFRPYKIPYDNLNLFDCDAEDEGFRFYQSHIVIDVENVDGNPSSLMTSLSAKLNKRFSEKAVGKSELTEIIKHFQGRFNDAFSKGAMSGFFAKLGLVKDIGLRAGNYITRKDAAQLSRTTKIASNMAKQAQKNEEENIKLSF